LEEKSNRNLLGKGKISPMSHVVLNGNCLDVLDTIPEKSVQCCVTSPPYWDQRNYENDHQIGQEEALDDYIQTMVKVFAKVKTCLSDDGILWLNIGDKYVNKAQQGIPWRVALALMNDGWVLRNDIIWHKPDCMPIPLRDRCASSHEYIFMFTKMPAGYYYDYKAIYEPLKHPNDISKTGGIGGKKHSSRGENSVYSGKAYDATKLEGKIRRDVWTIATSRSKEKHYAVFPEEIPRLAILASTKERQTVLDPFSGSGTSGIVAKKLNRNYIGIELNKEYAIISQKRIDSISTLGDVLV